MSAPVIEISGLHKTFRDFWFRPVAEAVNGIDLVVEQPSPHRRTRCR